MEVLLRLQAFGDPGQAFGNCFLFCVLDKTVRMKMKECWLCYKRNQNSGENNLGPSSQQDENESVDVSNSLITESNESVDDSNRLITESARWYGSISGLSHSFWQRF